MLPPAEILRSRMFDGLTDGERRQWLDRSERAEIRRGQPLARQGEPARALHLVEVGLLKLQQVTAGGHQLIVRFVGPGEPFGGVVALENARYPVTALAVEATVVRAWPRDVLADLFDAFPAVRVNLMREMADHMNDALTRVRELATERVGQRLAHTLLRLMRQCGRPGDDGIVIAHALTRQELAELVGTTLYTVSRTMAEWEAQGVLRSTRRELIVRAPKRLQALARSEERSPQS
jgi:CRP-like cAMP-binding protein